MCQHSLKYLKPMTTETTEMTDTDDCCCICLDTKTTGKIVISNCNHSFHEDCISKIINDNCPLCRKTMGINTESTTFTIGRDREMNYQEFFCYVTVL